MPHNYSGHNLRWDGDHLRLNSGRVVAMVEADGEWPNMYRVRLPDGHRTDMCNRTRARDAAISMALAALNRPLRAAA
jgi:hypothetical protein